MTRLACIVSVLLSLGLAQTNAPAITGVVVDPDGHPVTTGSVALMSSQNARVTAAIDRAGRFRVVPDTQGRQSLFISVPGFAPYRAHVDVPASRAMALPDIQLLQGTYFRVAFITPDGEPLSGSIRRRSFDADGMSIADPLEHTRERADASGGVLIGPLPTGRSLFTFDRPGWAMTRLRDANVDGSQKVINAGIITVGVGGTLQVDVVDAAGAAVPQHNVWLEDAVQPSPLSFSPSKTNTQGRAEFTGLAPGRYRVWTQTVERCGVAPLSVSRLVSSTGSGTTSARLVAGGRARLRITSALGPVSSKLVVISPDAPGQTPWQPQFASAPMGRRAMATGIRFSLGGCQGYTDAEGRLTVSAFPPGPADVRIPLINSTYIKRVNVPQSGNEIVIEIPDGLIPVKATDRANGHPVGSALAQWTGGGSKVEALTNANGDALIEAPGAAGGTLSLSARDYEPLEGSFTETPGTLQEVALTRSPSDRVLIHVETAEHKPIAGAVVRVASSRAGDADEISMTASNGDAYFAEIPPGSLRVTAVANGFAAGQQSVAAANRTAITVTLTREK